MTQALLGHLRPDGGQNDVITRLRKLKAVNYFQILSGITLVLIKSS